MKVMDIKPEAKTQLDVFSNWMNGMTAKLVASNGKKILVTYGTQIPVTTDIFNGFEWKINVSTPTKETYQKIYGENWEYHYHLYMVWNSRKF